MMRDYFGLGAFQKSSRKHLASYSLSLRARNCVLETVRKLQIVGCQKGSSHFPRPITSIWVSLTVMRGRIEL